MKLLSYTSCSDAPCLALTQVHHDKCCMPCQTERFLCRYLISQHPAVEAKLAAELDEAGLLVTAERPLPRAMEYADLGRLTYLNWVCKVSNS